MMLLYLASLVFLARFSISRERYAEIRRELEARKREAEGNA
jgi:Na+/melibiose symporter-like transporter